MPSSLSDLPVPLECHALTLNTIELQLSDTVADTSMSQCSAQLRILFINVNFVADNASHALASSATVKPTFNIEEEVVIIHNGWTPKEEEEEKEPSCTCFTSNKVNSWKIGKNQSCCMTISQHTNCSNWR